MRNFYIVINGLICELLFVAIVTGVIYLHSYVPIDHLKNEYIDIYKHMWLFVLSGFVSNIIAGLFNIYIMSKSKIMLKGKLFWLRSVFSTCVSELLLLFLIMLMSFIPILGIDITFKLFYHAYALEIIYAFIFAIPAQYLVNKIRKIENIDAYDYGVSYNPFRYFS